MALPAEDVLRRTTAIVTKKYPLNQDIIRLTLQCREPLDYRAGQFVHVSRPDGLTRSYSVARLTALKNWRVYLCGHPDMVKATRKQAFLAGASMKDIYADPFVISPKTV